MDAALRQREAEMMFLRAQNQHLKSDNKQLRTKIRSLSTSNSKKDATAQCAEDKVSLDSDDEILFVTSAVKKQVLLQ